MRKTYGSDAYDYEGYDIRDDMIRTLNKIYKEKAVEEWDRDLAVSEDYANATVKRDYNKSDIHKMLMDLMDHLHETGGDAFVLLKFPEIGEWYGQVLEKRRIDRVREEAKEKFRREFSSEEQKLLRDMIRMG